MECLENDEIAKSRVDEGEVIVLDENNTELLTDEKPMATPCAVSRIEDISDPIRVEFDNQIQHKDDDVIEMSQNLFEGSQAAESEVGAVSLVGTQRRFV